MFKQEPLLNAKLEKQRLIYVYKTHFITPETDKDGVGDVTDVRMNYTIKLNVEAGKLSTRRLWPMCLAGHSCRRSPSE